MSATGTAMACAAGWPSASTAPLVEERDVDVGDLGQISSAARDDDAGTQSGFTLRPQMPCQHLQHRQAARQADLGNAVDGGWRREWRHGDKKCLIWRARDGGGGSDGLLSCRTRRSNPHPRKTLHDISYVPIGFALCLGASAAAAAQERAPGRDRLRDHLARHGGLSHRRQCAFRRWPLRRRDQHLQERHPEGAHHELRRAQPRLGRLHGERRATGRRVAGHRGRRQDAHLDSRNTAPTAG